MFLRSIEASLVQFSNAYEPNVVLPEVKVTFLSPKQLPNVRSPILFNDEGNSMEVRLSQAAKAPLPMLVNLLWNFISVKLTQCPNVLIAILVTPSGIMIDCKLLQLWKASRPNSTNPLGKTILSRL